MTGSAARRPVIAGLGITEVGKVYDRDAGRFAADAVRLAVADAGLDLSDVDGLLVNPGTTGEIGVDLQSQLQIPELRLLSEVQAFGASAGAMVAQASLAVQAGMADVVVCVFADAPLRE
ncbi:thiolase family protein, partial [Saccharopolyspora kobensis]